MGTVWGILGHEVGDASLAGFNPLGGTLMMVALFLIGVTIFTDLSWIALAEGLGDERTHAVAEQR